MIALGDRWRSPTTTAMRCIAGGHRVRLRGIRTISRGYPTSSSWSSTSIRWWLDVLDRASWWPGRVSGICCTLADNGFGTLVGRQHSLSIDARGCVQRIRSAISCGLVVSVRMAQEDSQKRPCGGRVQRRRAIWTGDVDLARRPASIGTITDGAIATSHREPRSKVG